MLHFRSGKCSVFVTFMSTPRSSTKTCPVRPCAVLHFPGSRVRFVIAEVHPVAWNAKTCTVVLLLVFLEDMFGFHPFNFTSQLVHKAKKRAGFPLLRCAFCRTYSGFHCLNPNPRPLRRHEQVGAFVVLRFRVCYCFLIERRRLQLLRRKTSSAPELLVQRSHVRLLP